MGSQKRRLARDPTPLTKPRRRILWRTITIYIAVYENPRMDPGDGGRIVVRSFNPPPKKRTFRVSGGLRKFKRVQAKKTTREVIVVAKSAKTKKNKTDEEIEDQELEELEDLEDLDDLEDEDEDDEDTDDDSDDDEDEDESDDDEDDEDEEDEDEDEEEEEAPKKKGKSSKSKSAKGKSKKSRSRTTDGKVGTQEVAEHCGIDARSLRMVLRKHSIEKDEDTGRYEWSSLNHPVVKKIKKLVDQGAAKAAKREGLDKLKGSKSKKKNSGTKRKKAKK